MTAQVENIVLNSGLAGMHANCTHITVCSTEPTTYAQAATTYMLGYANLGANTAFGASSTGSPSGLQVASGAITNGTITGTSTQTANWWAACDETNGSLYAHGTLSAAQAVTNGNTFSLGSFTVTLPAH